MTHLQTTKQWKTLGLTTRQIGNARRSGERVKVRRGVDRDPGELSAADRHRALIRATLPLLHPDSVVSHASAALLHGLPVRHGDAERVQITRLGPAHGRRRRLVALHAAPLAKDEVTLIDGIPVTSLARTVADLARTASFEWAVIAADAALHAGLDPQTLAEQLERHPRRRGLTKGRAVLAFADARSESPCESLSRVQFARMDLPMPTLQHTIRDGNRILARCDFWWEEFHLAGEADGKIKYAAPDRPGETAADVIMREKAREEQLLDHDVHLVRWGWDVAMNRPALEKRVRAALRRTRRAAA